MIRKPSLVRSDHEGIPPSVIHAAARHGKVSTYRDRFRLSVHPLVAQVNASVDELLDDGDEKKTTPSDGVTPAERELLIDGFRQYAMPAAVTQASTGKGAKVPLAATTTGPPSPGKRGITPTPNGLGGPKLTPIARTTPPADLPRQARTPGLLGPGRTEASVHDSPGDAPSKEALIAGFNERFGNAFRPMSVARSRLGTASIPETPFSNTRPTSQTSTRRASSALASYDVMMKTITREGAIARRETRSYIRNVTELLRHDNALFSAFASQYDDLDRSQSDDERNFEAANKLRAAQIRELEAEHRARLVEHTKHCETVYEVKQQNILAEYMKLEEGLTAVRGEAFSRGRLWRGLMTTAKAFLCFRSIIDRRREEQTEEFVKSVFLQHSVNGPISPDKHAQSFRVKSPSLGPASAAPLNMLNLDIIAGVHKNKFNLVEQRRDMQRQCAQRDPDGLKRLVASLKTACMGYWLKRAIRRKQAAALTILLEFLRRARERARARIAIKSFLYHTKLLVRRWKEAFRRERERVASAGKQWDHYLAERITYDRITCADAEREVKRREKAIAKANMAKKQTESSVAQALSPIRTHRAAVERVNRAGSVFKEITAPAPPALTPLQVSRIVAAPFLLPHPYGPRLGPDPTSSRVAALATLNALGFDRMIWKVPARTKDFVVRFFIARERVSHATQITKWCNDVAAAEAKHRALLAVANVASGTALVQVTQELAKFALPRMPRRQVFLRPNEMRFWVHFGIMLYAQERRQAHDNNVNEKFVDPATVAAVYNVRNATAVMKRCLAQLGEKLSNVRPGYFDDLPFPVDVAPPTIPESLLPPNARAAAAATASGTAAPAT